MGAAPAPLETPTFRWPWGRRTYVMGILNVTPDSFSGDGLAGQALPAVVERARAMVAAGADAIDVGGESTRPGHRPVGVDEELRRVVPVVAALAEALPVPVSVDTEKAAVAEAALRAGARVVNDVRGLTADPEMATVVAAAGAPVVIMHDRKVERAERLIPDVARELSARIDRALAAGIAWERIIVDPGFGFGKTAALNLELLRRLRELTALGRPILVGTSRKGTIGQVLGAGPADRLEGTAATVALAIANGADLVRVHDVAPMVRVARMADAVVRGWSPG
ncbi:MAG TPA: dihydropteroate synthase [Thermomicrobiaceae bacterium]|nr:dihydropteroate synthase [Thermomicrobiaceae bacterium]